MLEPNDLPLVCLPLNLPPDAAAELIEFLQQLTEALERHYATVLKHHYAAIANAEQRSVDADPPF